MAHGKTLLMRNIRTSSPQYVQRYVGAPRTIRRHRKLLWKGSFLANEPYTNPARDLRKDRKLRSDA